MAKILIVDDSPVDRKIIGKVIRDGVEGIEILENSDGVNLVHQVREKGVQLVVLDLMLPGVSGLDLLKALKAHEDTRDVPVIVCSGLVEDEVIRDSLYLGAFDYFEKPLTDRAVRFMLAMKVRNALELVKRAVEVAFLREHDQITLMSTRTHFESVLEGYQIESNYPLTYLMMDIDGLKIFNDAYGRAAGDRLLKRVGQYFSREIDGLHLSARWGSDEFLLLLSNYDQHRC